MWAKAAPIGVLFLIAAQDTRWNWSTADLSDIGEYAAGHVETQKLCAAVLHSEPPASDLPTEVEFTTLKDCDSEALYFGIGMRADPVKARKCAVIEDRRQPYGGPAQPYYGRAMLALIYANGAGVRQDYDVAMHMACGVENAAAETGDRIERLASLRASRAKTPLFDTCDGISSGALGGMCAGHQSRIADVKRKARLAVLAARRGLQRPEWLALNERAEEFATAVADNEVDLSGTLRGAFWIEAHDNEIENFVTMLEQLEAGTIKPKTKAEYLRSDAELNRRYRAALGDKERYEYGTVKPEGVRAAQRAWLRYRDAMLGFARIYYPRASTYGLAARLAKDRSSSF